MRGAKRSAAYRRYRRYVTSACPLDVWVEGKLGFVHFDLALPDGRPSWLVFAVRRADGDADGGAYSDADGRLVAAKLLWPVENGDSLVVRDIL